MLYFKDYNFAFLHINKAGGSTVVKFLEEVLTGPVEQIALQPEPGTTYVHEYLAAKKAKLTEMSVDFDALKILTTVRNPYERWISLYTSALRNFKENRAGKVNLRELKATSMPFHVWLEHYVFPDKTVQHGPQVNYLFIDGIVPKNLKIIRLEDLDVEFPRYLNSKLGFNAEVMPPRKNISNYMRDRGTMDYYTQDLKKIVYRLDKWLIDTYYPEVKDVGLF